MVIKINGASRVQRAGLLEMPSGIDFKSNKSHKALCRETQRPEKTCPIPLI